MRGLTVRIQRRPACGRLLQGAVMEVDALIADNLMRSRDERFATQDRHKEVPDPLYDKSSPEKKPTTYLY